MVRVRVRVRLGLGLGLGSGSGDKDALEVGPVHCAVPNDRLAAAVLVDPRAGVEPRVLARQHVRDLAVGCPARHNLQILHQQTVPRRDAQGLMTAARVSRAAMRSERSSSCAAGSGTTPQYTMLLCPRCSVWGHANSRINMTKLHCQTYGLVHNSNLRSFDSASCTTERGCEVP